MKPVTFKPSSSNGYQTSDFKSGIILLVHDAGAPDRQLLLQVDKDEFYVLGVRNKAYDRHPGEDFMFITYYDSYPKDRIQEVERSDLPLFMDFNLDDRFKKILEKNKI